MKFVLKPSLEHMALVKIVTMLWNQNDVRAQLPKFYNLYSCEGWKIMERIILCKVFKLPLPKLLMEKVLCLIKPIGLQIVGWMQFHSKCFHLRAHLPAEFCWTPHGTIDRKKTAEVLIKDENLDMSTRYKLACIYCLEEDIIHFWNTMPEDLKKSFSYASQIIGFWSHYMKKGLVGNFSYKYEFHQSVSWDNKVAAEYFLQKLTPKEKKESLVESLKNVTDPETLCFLISEMDEDHQMTVFKLNPRKVLYSFLQWPLQNFFIQIVNCMWDFLSKSHYNSVLIKIINKVRMYGYKDWNYQMLFREFWQKIPDALKSCIAAEIDKGDVLLSLCQIKDKEIFRLILKGATITVKEKLIYSDTGKSFCERFIRDNEWDFLEFFIREFLPSNNEMLKFKEDFEKYIIYSCCKEQFATKKHKWDQIFIFPDDSILNYDKRNVEEGESSSSKRFRSQQ